MFGSITIYREWLGELFAKIVLFIKVSGWGRKYAGTEIVVEVLVLIL